MIDDEREQQLRKIYMAASLSIHLYLPITEASDIPEAYWSLVQSRFHTEDRSVLDILCNKAEMTCGDVLPLLVV